MKELILKLLEIDWVIALVCSTGAVTIFLFLKRLIWKRLRHVTEKMPTPLYGKLLDTLISPITGLCFLFGVLIGIHAAPDIVHKLTALVTTLKVLALLCTFWALDRIIRTLVKSISLPNGVSENVRPLIKTISRTTLIVLCFIITLDTVGVSITPILASLGVGSLAVALALQDTLSNFFSGVYLQFDQPVRIGDYVRLEDGSSGHVARIAWRCTHIRLSSNNTIIIPNSKLSTSIITNYDLPEKESAMEIQVGVAYGSDLNKVEQVTNEVSKMILQSVNGGVAQFTPHIRFHTFADSSINFTVGLRVQHWTDQALIKHEFIKALHSRFQKENIEIPYPHRVIHTQSLQLNS